MPYALTEPCLWPDNALHEKMVRDDFGAAEPGVASADGAPPEEAQALLNNGRDETFMHSYKGLLTTLFSTGGSAAAWALLDGILGTLLARLGVIGGVRGILWGWRSHRAKMKTMKLEQEQKALEIAQLRGKRGSKGRPSRS